MSRSPIREALRTLYADGFLERVPHRGYTVKQLDIRSAMELYEVRMALELFTVEQLALTGIGNDILDRLAEPWSAAQCDTYRLGEELAELDRSFHEGLARETGNGTLIRNIQEINDRIHVFRVIDLGNKETVESTCVQHRRIIEKIRERDPAGSREAMRTNIDYARGNVESTLKEALARAYFGQRGDV